MAHRKEKIPARLAEEEYQLRHERVAGVDIAKAKADVCVRLPPREGRSRRQARAWEVAATVPAARLAEIPGVSLHLATAIIAETGLGMSRFPTAAHLVSWAGLAPSARQSGTRSRKPGKGKGNACLKGYCTQAAIGTARADTFLGERLRRLSRRTGGARAQCAVARSILVITWHLLNDPAARYTDLGPGWHARKTDRDKKITGHLRQLRALGLEVTITETDAAAAA